MSAASPLHRPALLPSATDLGARDEINAIEATPHLPGQLTIGTRASQLALVQAHLVRDALSQAFPEHPLHIAPMSTTGDKNQTQALYLMGGKALWTQELEVALLEGAVDLIVHSLKDMPTALPEGCMLGAITQREDERDALVIKQGLPYKRLEDLPPGAVIGTSSVRRVAQLRRSFPHLVFADVRGNLNTRLAKLDKPDGPFSALILASAGLIRLNMADRITSPISGPNLLHAVGQGALGIEIRSTDAAVARMVRALEHWQTAWRALAEREMLRVLEGGCSVPVGCETRLVELPLPASFANGHATNGVGIHQPPRMARLTLIACIASLSGHQYVEYSETRICSSPLEAEALGHAVADALVARGGRKILQELGRRVEDESFAQRHAAAVAGAIARSAHGISPPNGDLHCG